MKILLIIIAASLIAFVGVPWLARRGAANFSDAALARYAALAANEEAAEVPEDQLPFVVGRTLIIDRAGDAPSVDAAFLQIDPTRRAGSEDEVRTVIAVERGYSITAADRVFDSSTGRLASPPPVAGSEGTTLVVVDAKENRVLARCVIAGDDVAQAFAKMPGIDETSAGLFDLMRDMTRKKH